MNTYIKKKMINVAGLYIKALGIFLVASILSVPWASAVNPPTMYDYTAVPPFIDQSVKPNILIMLDNSGSMNEYVYEGQHYDPDRNYYGYFTSDYRYTFGQRFAIDNASGQWSGNFLNFMTMRRIDVMRKVVTGGKPTSAMGHGAMRLWQEDKTGYGYYHLYRYVGGDVSPFDGDYWYYMADDGKIHVYTYTNRWNWQGSYDVIVQKDPVLEPDDFYDYDGDGQMRLAGVLQRFGHDANWGNIWFVEDSKNNTNQGGAISNPVGPHAQFSSLINDLRNKPADKWTPLAETYYVAMQHFRSQAVEISGYESQASQPNHDPFDHSEWCAKNFVLILTDGASTRDAVIPTYLKDYADDISPSYFITDEDGSGYTNTSGRYPDGGTDFLKDVVYYARTNDLRPPGAKHVDGHTHLIPYIVFAFEEDDNARNLLLEAARQGGFRRQINDNIPGLAWKDGENVILDDYAKEDLIPDNYFEARDGHGIENALRNAILGILNRAASGTAASVVTPDGRGEGEGSVIQAYFVPVRTSDEYELKWSGYLHSMWIDPCGNLREDSTGNRTLDYANDYIINYAYYADDGALVQRFAPVLEDGVLVCPGYDPDSPFGEPFEMHELESIFEAGRMLWERIVDPAAAGYDADKDRRIYTYSDDDPDGMVEFRYVAGDDEIIPYLGVNNASVSNVYNLDHLGLSTDVRAERLINYIRGIDRPELRNRTIDIDGETHVWKLGNIVNSTPVVIAGAVEQYHLIYSDPTYRDYLTAQRGRETMVYVGANDGKLHAFTHGTYDRNDKKFNAVDGDAVGTEVWSYIPRVLLPHLKWLADPGYTHVYYADLQPKVFDAKLNGNWGTFLLLGLNKGGKRIYVNIDGNAEILYPSYTLIDITVPREPKVLWERSYQGSGLTSSIPAVLKVGEKWFAAFGSGPNDNTGKTDYDGHSDQRSKIFIIDLENGDPFGTAGNDWFVELAHDRGFLNSPTAFDKNVNYNVDALYFGETYQHIQGNTKTWRGNIHKINIPCDPCDYAPDYEIIPSNWSHSRLFESPGPVTAQLNMRRDPDDNVMIYFGTGRYLSLEDKHDTRQQYMYGIKDPFYDKRDNEGFYLNYAQSKTMTVNNSTLFHANPIDVTDQGYVFNQAGLFTAGGVEGAWDPFVQYVRENHDGWYRTLNTTSGFPSERIISRASLIGGTLLVPTFTPIDDVCDPLGETNILALYYQTGTGFKRHVLSPDESPGNRNHPDLGAQAITAIRFKDVFVGAPASSITLHSGGGGREFAILQLDTAQQVIFEYDPDLQRSRLTGWRDR